MNFDFVLSAASLAGVVGAVISVVTTLFPKLNVLFASKPPEIKRSIQLFIGLGVSVIIIVLSCWTSLIIVVCTKEAWWITAIQVITVWVGYAMGNQAAFMIFPKPEAVVVATLQANAERNISLKDQIKETKVTLEA